MSYEQLLNRAYMLAIRNPQLGLIDDLYLMTSIELDCAINMMMRLAGG